MTTEVSLAITSFDSTPDALYTLDTAAHLAGVPRRAILVYCKFGLIHPIVEPAFGGLYFNDSAIRAIRQAEQLRLSHGIGLGGIRLIFQLLREVERLREEVRFLRG
jgi:DNA-binding transcriptional MerR regulator